MWGFSSTQWSGWCVSACTQCPILPTSPPLSAPRLPPSAWLHPLLDAFLVACMLRPIPRLRVRLLALVGCLLGVPAACGGQIALAYLVDPLLPPWLRFCTTLHCCVLIPLTVGLVYIMLWSPEVRFPRDQVAGGGQC